MRRLAIALATALLAVAGAAPAQQYYKWKDANGVTHYTKTPPPEGTEADRVAVRPGPVAPEPAGDAATPATGQGMAPEVAQRRNAACETARSNLNTLEANPFVSMDKDGDGTVELLTVEEHNAQLVRAREQVRMLCPATPGG